MIASNMKSDNPKKRRLPSWDSEMTSQPKRKLSARKCKSASCKTCKVRCSVGEECSECGGVLMLGWFRVPPFGLDVSDKDNDIYKRTCINCGRFNWIGKWCPFKCRLSETIVDPDDINEDNV